MWLLRIAGLLLSPASLGLYLLARRIADTGSNLIQVGMPVAVRRYLALDTNPNTRLVYLLSGITVVGVTGLLTMSLAVAAPQWWVEVFFPQDTIASVAVATAGFTLALAATNLAVSTLAADRHFIVVNVLYLLNNSLWALGAFWWWGFDTTVTGALTVQAVASLAVASLTLAIVVLRHRRRISATHFSEPPTDVLTRFLQYGFARTFSPFVETLLLLTAAWVLRDQVIEVGYLLLALTILRLANIVLMPIGTVAGVVTAQLAGRRDERKISYGVNLLVGTLVVIGIIGFAVGYPWIPLFLDLWLKDAILAAGVGQYTTILAIAFVPYVFYQGVKQVVDMLWLAPRTLYAGLLALTILLVVWLMGDQFGSASVRIQLGLVLSLSAASVLCLTWLRPRLKPTKYFGIPQLTVSAAMLFFINSLAARLANGHGPLEQVITAVITIVTSLGLALPALIVLWPSQFVRDLRQFWSRSLSN